MFKLPTGVDINNLIDDLRIFSWEASEILLNYSQIIKDPNCKKNIIKINHAEGPVTLADLNVNDLKGKKMILLDGHHRYEYLKRNDIKKSIELVLISIDDVEILSYPSRLTIRKKEFEEILKTVSYTHLTLPTIE